ncbi:AsmA-like C-terminal region-containing protein [Bradyrhizobium sp.]|uniref:AsmA family protein n=1 Tax=Bradyrhizobium sp. TaxID=376 RepID=UPI002E09038C|nr:AsmA-like C-terminal region-containing protein [Bradyrhizobium sp.]
MQTTLLGLAIAFIIALIAALVGPYFIDWNQFRPQFEAEATRIIGAQVRVGGALDARLLPTPSLRLRSVAVGAANDLGKVRADKLDVEFNLGSLMRGEWRATELTINGVALNLGLDAQGRIDWPVSTGTFNLGSLAIDRLNLTGRIALHDAASRGALELNDIAFSGDVRSLAGSIRGDGNFLLSGTRYPFRVSSGQSPDRGGTRLHLTVDPGTRALSVDLDGVLTFEGRAPRFDGAVTLAGPAEPKAGGVTQTPWRLSARLKADPAMARLEQLEASYGLDETALKFAGLADVRFGASPLLHAVLSARQLDADKLLGKDNSAAEPTRLLPGLRNLVAAIPPALLATQIEVSAEQIMLGGRPVQSFGADLRGDPKAWTIDRLEFRAPGATRVALNGQIAPSGPSGSFKGALSVDSTDSNTLAGWLQGRSEIAYRNQKPLRVNGNLTVASDRIAIDGLKAEIDGGALEGRVAVLDRTAAGASRVEAALKADRLDLEAATAFTRSLAGPEPEWPDEAQLSLDIGRAVVAGQELRPFVAKLSYGPKTILLDHLKIGDAGGVMMEGAGSFDRANATGKLALNAIAASFAQFTGLIAPVAPAIGVRLNAMAVRPGPARLKLSLELDRNPDRADRANAHAVLDLDAPDFKGVATMTATPVIAAMRGIDLDALGRSEIGIESKLSARGQSLLTLLGLERAIAAGDGTAQFEGSATGMWRGPLRLKARLSGTQLDAEAQGTAEPWASQPNAAVNLSVLRANLAPLFDLNRSNASASISLSSRLNLAGSKLTFDDLDGVVGGSRIRGRIALELGDEKAVDGEVGMDTLDLASAFALALGAAGHDASEPLGRGLLQGWRGRLAFQALRGVLPGSGEVRPVSGVLRGDGQSLTFDDLKGAIGGGEATAAVEAKQTVNGLAVNARLQFSGVDGSALRYRALAMPAGRASMRMTLASQGRSASALAGALSGSGLLTLEAARIAGLDPRAFEVAVRASDNGTATDDVKLRQIVEPVLSGGVLSVASAQIPFNIRDGALRVGATTLDAEGARAIVSGGYDMSADQTDIRAALTSTAAGSATSRPEIQVYAVGSPDALDRTVDVAALSSWLAVRAIDRETRRLDSIERGELPLPALPAAIPPPAMAQPPAETHPAAALPDLRTPEVQVPGRDPRRYPPKPRVSAPPVAPPLSHAPVVSQQVAPLPPPIEIRPAPGPPVRPKPRPPLVLTPPVQTMPR